MPILEFTRNFSYMGDDFLSKKVHIICPAVNGLTVYNVFANGIGGIDNKYADELATTVNNKNETGTLFPKLNLTIIPLTVYNDRNDFGKRTIMEKHIEDCFEAETKYIKSSNMIFVFEQRIDFDNELAVDVLLKNWAKTSIRVEYTPT